MALQRVFTSNYIKQLSTHICTEDYLQEAFPYDPSQTRTLLRIKHPETLCDFMVDNYKNDFLCGVALYEAFKEISPIFAQDDNLWVYLSHVDLFPYLQKRWPIPAEEEKRKAFIRDHWFRSPNGIIRSALMGMWWSVYLTIDEDRANPYELTEILFSNYSFRVVYFGATRLFRYREVGSGVLQFFKECPKAMDNMELNIRAITKYIDQLGGVKRLSSLHREYITEECHRISDKIFALRTREEVQNKDIYSIINGI